MGGFNVNTFKESIAQYGVIRTSHFDVVVTPPPMFTAGDSTLSNKGRVVEAQGLARVFTMRVEAVKIPGVALQAGPVARYGIGPTQKMPFSAEFIDTSFTFTCDKFGDLWNFWYQWVRGVFGFAGLDNSTGTSTMNTPASYQANYKADYAVTMSVLVYDDLGIVAQVVNLYDAFPVSINEQQVEWGAKGVVKMTVGITFREMTVEGVGVGSTGNIQAAEAATPTSPSNPTQAYVSPVPPEMQAAETARSAFFANPQNSYTPNP